MKWLLALALLAQPSSQPASQPALPGGGTGADVVGQVTIVVEVDEHHLKTQESWALSNSSGKLIEAAELSFGLPEGSRRLNLDEDVVGFEAAPDASRFYATAPLAGGTTTVAGAYLWDFDGDTASTQRKMPVNVNGMRLIVEDIAGVKVSSNLQFQSRVRELNGLRFAIYDFTPLQAGQTFELTLAGLPSRTTLPRNAAMATVFALVLWTLFQIARPRPAIGSTLGPLSAQARRDQIVKALEILDRDHREEKVKPKRYERRHQELIQELASVLKEIDLATPRSGHG